MEYINKKRQLSETDDDYVMKSDKKIKLESVNNILSKLYNYLYENYNEAIMMDIIFCTLDIHRYECIIHNRNIDKIKQLLYYKLNQSQYSYILDIPKIIEYISRYS